MTATLSGVLVAVATIIGVQILTGTVSDVLVDDVDDPLSRGFCIAIVRCGSSDGVYRTRVFSESHEFVKSEKSWQK